MYSLEPFKVFLAVIATCLAVESLCYLLVFRRPIFKSVKSDLIASTAKLDALKAKGPGSEKQVKKMEESMVKLQANIYVFRMQTMAIQFIMLAGAWRMMSQTYKGVPLAKLPFVPFKFVTRMTHASLPGEDMTDLAFTGMYALSSMVVRGLVTKFVNKEDQAVLIPKNNVMEKWAQGKME